MSALQEGPSFDDMCDAEQWLVKHPNALRWIVTDGDDGRAYKCTITWTWQAWPFSIETKEVGSIGRGDTRTQAVTRAVSAAREMLAKHPPS